MAHYYNEFDPYCAEWLQRLMRAGLIPDGEVDERDIRQVQAVDLRGFTSCHFFAGIGGWSHALRLAGWPDDRPVWTGSCPCQSFSTAGKRKGVKDERHLWPDFFRLIRECHPDTVFGEQVEGAIGHGWLDGVQADLEGEGYTVGHCVLGAHSVGADHKRQRLYWVADAGRRRVRDLGYQLGGAAGVVGREVREQRVRADTGDGGGPSFGVADTGSGEWCGRTDEPRPDVQTAAEWVQEAVHNQRCGPTCAVGVGHGSNTNGTRQRSSPGGVRDQRNDTGRGCETCGLGDPESVGGGWWSSGRSGGGNGSASVGSIQLGRHGSPCGVEYSTSDGRGEGRAESGGRSVAGRCESGGMGDTSGSGQSEGDAVSRRPATGAGVSGPSRVVGVAHDARSQGRGVSGGERAGELPAGAAGGSYFWVDSEFVLCRDGKVRRIPKGGVESGLFPLAHGFSGRVAVARPGEQAVATDAEREIRWVSRTGALRGAGNAIVPQVAAEFITAFMDYDRERSG